ncbi:MAG: adenylosuccinate synthase [Chitinophagales bacterium]
MSVDVLLGLQWGDEGKGKIVDYLANNYDLIARFQGGANAGHTLYIKGKKIVLHNIPSGVFHERPLNLIGNGMVIDPVAFKKEVEEITVFGTDIHQKLVLAKKAHLTIPTHKILDAASEAAKGKAKIGSTLRGISPTYMDKIGRNGLRIGDILLPDFEERYQKLKAKHEELLSRLYDFDYNLEEMEAEWREGIEVMRSFTLVEGEYFVNQFLKDGKTILAEGAQGSMLDIDFGTYPYVTSSNTITAGVCNGLGVAPQHIRDVIGITKAYCTRVGAGPFPSELENEKGDELRRVGGEFGATTGRPRRCGWIDLPALRYAIMLNGVTKVVMTKVDILSEFETIEVCEHYLVDGLKQNYLPFDLTKQKIEPVYRTFEGWQSSLDNLETFDQLPQKLQTYIQYIEEELEAPVEILSTGPKRNELVFKAVEEVMV